MDKKYLFDASITLYNGTKIYGPVTTIDDQKFHFENHTPNPDYWVDIEKIKGFWKIVGGTTGIPVEHLIELGSQIDAHFTEPT